MELVRSLLRGMWSALRIGAAYAGRGLRWYLKAVRAQPRLLGKLILGGFGPLVLCFGCMVVFTILPSLDAVNSVAEAETAPVALKEAKLAATATLEPAATPTALPPTDTLTPSPVPATVTPSPTASATATDTATPTRIPSATPTITPAPSTATPDAPIARPVGLIDVRSLASESGQFQFAIGESSSIWIMGLNDSRDWALIADSAGRQGWVRIADLVTDTTVDNGGLDALESIATNVPPTQSPATNTPTATATSIPLPTSPPPTAPPPTVPPPTAPPQPTQPPAQNCDPSYPTVCIPPPPPDLDCGDIPFRRFQVVGSDPHRFDGDNDGIGCES